MDYENVELLVKASFGRRFSGDLKFDYVGGSLLDADTGLVHTNAPNLIGRQNFFCSTAIGSFEIGNDSVINILPRYVENAVKYAEMYESKTGAEVKIRLAHWDDRKKTFVPIYS